MSCFCYSSLGDHQQVRATTERIKVLKVVGEAVGQLVFQNTVSLNAIKIINIDADLKNFEDHVFFGKVVKQGTVHIQILYVDPDGVVRDFQEDSPFTLTVEIPGIKKTPFTEVQNHVLDIDTDFILKPSCKCDDEARVDVKVIAHVLVKVSEWTQLDVITKVDVFPKVNSLSQASCCKKW
ncbi:uncharacterized protein DUF3794 [Hydrogenispora ethanolica]|jgi:hypothetical protein|uniref:Uncharacterized protein DUF3794 n=1 Tax=Hydrogenispora ethanolica TaxID=1082276 RepID=A0A4V2QG15_HYDET|nr:DUF3794 domain-containing protein [Hydrogenispora ethanolica]TCL74067.1 uncharacterized protein DUF3794 [Hydrogenispora ethanolica]